MMHTENTIYIEAEPELIFSLAADIARWPEILPHYRWVHVFEENGNERIAEMAAQHYHWPVKWTSLQQLFPNEYRIVYRHIRGITVGMEVEWRLTPQNGGTHVSIVHDLFPSRSILRNRLASWIIGDFFVKGIASRTLAHIKRLAEAQASKLSITR